MKRTTLFYSLIGSLNALTCLLSAEEVASEPDTPAPKMTTNRYERAVNPPADLRARDGWNVFITGEALYWTARETGLEYVFKTKVDDTITVTPNFTPDGQDVTSISNSEGKARGPDFGWDWGFRVGLGYNIPHDFWDLHLLWTRFHTTETDQVTTRLPTIIIDDVNFVFTATGEMLNPTWGLLNDFIDSSFSQNSAQGFTTKAKAKWNLRTDLLDLELGRKFFVAKWLTLRPHAGLRNGWIRQKFDVSYSGSTPAVFDSSLTFTDKIHIKNNFWGIGPRAGLDTQWGLIREFSIYAKAAISLLYGDFDVQQKEQFNFLIVEVDDPIEDIDRSAGVIFDKQSNSFWTTRAITDLALGLQWDHYFASDRVHLGLNLGWENHIFFGQNQMLRFILNSLGVGGSPFTTNNGDLTLQGVVLGARLDF